ncbi:MAG: hypothetical protein ABEJ23_07245 [Haloarculaceae archaeon]
MSTADLASAADRRERLRDRITEYGEDDARAVADAYRRFSDLLGRYEDRATGTGNFETYVEFQESVARLVEDLPEDLPERTAFEEAGDVLEQRTLRAKHFRRARDALAPARDLADLLADWEAARERYREERVAVAERIEALDERVADLERLLELGEADLDAPVDRLRDPIEAYDDAVSEAFLSFKREASAREVLDVVESAAAYPLVAFAAPPTRLHGFVASEPAGEESIPTLLEYADYSASKLDHYVDDAAAIKRHVATNRTYLEGLDGGPLTVGWPPPSADRLRWTCREYEAVVHRFADAAVVERLRAVQALAREDDYARLQEAAVARSELDEREREDLRSGAVERQLAEAREERADLAAALADSPEL